MQGVVARGTARAISGLAPYVAGKTGTSDKENDAWFVGFTNDVTVAVWLGYDNASGKRSTLGGGDTGGGIAVPIVEPMIQAVWANVRRKPRRPAIAGSQTPAHVQVDRSGVRRSARRRRKGDHRMFPDRPSRPSSRHPVSAGVAGGRLRCAQIARLVRRRSKSLWLRHPPGLSRLPGLSRISGLSRFPGSARLLLRQQRPLLPVPREPVQPSAQSYGQSGSNGHEPRSPAPPRNPDRREYQTPQRIGRRLHLGQPAVLMKDVMMRSLKCGALALGLGVSVVTCDAQVRAQEFTIAEVTSAAGSTWTNSSRSHHVPGRPSEELGDPDAGLVRFEDGRRRSRSKSRSCLHCRAMSNRIPRSRSMRCEALQGKAPYVRGRGALRAGAAPCFNLILQARVTLPFVERIDPAIKRPPDFIVGGGCVSPKVPRAVNNQHPLRRWGCKEPRPPTGSSLTLYGSRGAALWTLQDDQDKPERRFTERAPGLSRVEGQHPCSRLRKSRRWAWRP